MRKDRLPAWIWNLEEELYRTYESLLKEGKQTPAEADVKTSPEIGDLRIFLIDPPIYLVIAEYLEDELYMCIPLTEFWFLAKTSRIPPKIVLKRYKIVLSPLPFRTYFTRRVLYTYTKKLASLNNEYISQIVKYVDGVNYKVGGIRQKFMESEIRRLGPHVIGNIMEYLSQLEEEEEPYILLPDVALDRSYALASTTNAFKGKNWLGVYEDDILYIYLPEELVGKKIRITFFGQVVYEGELKAHLLKIRVKDRSQLAHIQEELYVQVL
ncbi:MAG: hypothetical protein ABIM44_06330 [candidate division WOR-3 bacterium]